MAYDKDISSGSLDVETKRRVWRVDFERPPVAGTEGSLYANCFLKEDTLISGSSTVLSSKNYLITVNRYQILARTNAASFLNSMVGFISDLKDEYDATGSLATGSVGLLS